MILASAKMTKIALILLFLGTTGTVMVIASNNQYWLRDSSNGILYPNITTDGINVSGIGYFKTDSLKVNFKNVCLSDGTRCKSVMNGTNGINGVNGSRGQAGLNGTNGINGVAGKNGTNGYNGTDGIQNASLYLVKTNQRYNETPRLNLLIATESADNTTQSVQFAICRADNSTQAVLIQSALTNNATLTALKAGKGTKQCAGGQYLYNITTNGGVTGLCAVENTGTVTSITRGDGFTSKGTSITTTGTLNIRNQTLLNISGTDTQQCSGTDKVTNVTFRNGGLSILCGTDQSSASATKGKQVIGGRSITSLTADITEHPYGSSEGASDATLGMQIHTAGKIYNMTVYMSALQGLGDTCGITIRKAPALCTGVFVDTALACTFSGVLGTCTDYGTPVATSADDCIQVFFDESAGTCVGFVSWSFYYEET